MIKHCISHIDYSIIERIFTEHTLIWSTNAYWALVLDWPLHACPEQGPWVRMPGLGAEGQKPVGSSRLSPIAEGWDVPQGWADLPQLPSKQPTLRPESKTRAGCWARLAEGRRPSPWPPSWPHGCFVICSLSQKEVQFAQEARFVYSELLGLALFRVLFKCWQLGILTRGCSVSPCSRLTGWSFPKSIPLSFPLSPSSSPAYTFLFLIALSAFVSTSK